MFARAWAAVALTLLLSSTLSGTVSSLSAVKQLCADQGSQPVIQDKDWRLINPSSNYSDYALQYNTPFVMRAGSGFVMYLRVDNTTSGASGIYRGTSQDGAKWSIAPTSVLGTGANGTWDSSVVFSPDVMWNGTGFLMYYVGDGNYPANFRQIGVAFSSNGVTWTKYAGNPVIAHGPGVYDARYTRGPSMLYDNGTYKMWYFGTPPLSAFSNYTSNIDYATSTDGVHWAKYAGNPVLTGFNYSGTLVAHSPSVLKVNGTYLMAFSDGYANIGYATSTNGVRWSFNNGTDILESLSGWHSGYVDFPALLLLGNRLFMWFDGNNNTRVPSAPYAGGIGLAVCGVAIIPPPQVAVTSTTVTSTLISTSISTSIQPTTVVSTTTLFQDAPLADQLSVAVVALSGTLAVALAALFLRMRSAVRH